MKLRTIGRKLKPPQRMKLRQPERVVAGFYHTPQWRQLIDEIIRHRGRYCQDPQHDSTKPRTGRIFGDHVIELKDGGQPLDPANVLLRCGSCHTKKTMVERAKRYRRPVDNKGIRPPTSSWGSPNYPTISNGWGVVESGGSGSSYERAPRHARPTFGGGGS